MAKEVNFFFWRRALTALYSRRLRITRNKRRRLTKTITLFQSKRLLQYEKKKICRKNGFMICRSTTIIPCLFKPADTAKRDLGEMRPWIYRISTKSFTGSTPAAAPKKATISSKTRGKGRASSIRKRKHLGLGWHLIMRLKLALYLIKLSGPGLLFFFSLSWYRYAVHLGDSSNSLFVLCKSYRLCSERNKEKKRGEKGGLQNKKLATETKAASH